MDEQAARQSRELFQSGFYCAESVLMAAASSLHIESEVIPRIATGFCSGMARTGGPCGAVSGAIMVIGLSTGRQSPAESLEPSYALVRELLTRFQEQFGATHCRALLRCDLDSREGQQYFLAHHLMERCHDYAEGATRIVLALLEERHRQL